jgi:hypothetical protein
MAAPGNTTSLYCRAASSNNLTIIMIKTYFPSETQFISQCNKRQSLFTKFDSILDSMKPIIFAFLLLTFTDLAYAQSLTPPFRYYIITDFKSMSNPADSFYYSKDYRSAVKEYQKISATSDPQVDVMFNIAGCYSLIENLDCAFSILDKLIQLKFLNIIYLEHCADLNNLKSDRRWGNIIKECKRNLTEFEKDKNIKLPNVRLKLLLLEEYDQFTDRIQFIKRSYDAYPDISMDYIQTEKAIIYKKGFSTLKDLTKKYGVLGKSKVGEDGAEAYWLITQHADYDLTSQQRILKLMESATNYGEFKKEQIAYLTDRILKGQNKHQLYGTQFWMNPDTKNWELYPIQDPEKVDERRISMGLSPLDQYINNRIK